MIGQRRRGRAATVLGFALILAFGYIALHAWLAGWLVWVVVFLALALAAWALV